MKITIDLDSKDPLYAQLVDQIKQLVDSQALKANDALPSIRQLATDLDINKKTVAKAFQLLERDGVIVSKGYRGSFIHENATSNTQINIHQQAEQKFEALLQQLKQTGLTDSEIRNLFNQLMAKK